MREIKFRAYDTDDNEMYFPLVMAVVDNVLSPLRNWKDGNKAYKPHHPIMQYTELKDKFGVEIYEGDIWQDEDGMTYTIDFAEGEFAAFKYGYYRQPGLLVFGKVIGNIHQNKDLLNKEAEKMILELKPLSQISDEDAIEVAKILDFIIGHGLRIKRDECKWVMYSAYNDEPLKKSTLFFHFNKSFELYSLDEEGKVFDYDFERLLMVADFLRSRGYALPYLK